MNPQKELLWGLWVDMLCTALNRRRVWDFLRSTASELLGGSWVVISGVISRITIIITPIRGLITRLITTHEPPSTLNYHDLRPAEQQGLLVQGSGGD